MFGLDARIALAIFGALSVISGAALYSAIQISKATALLVELQELGKGLESYMLDTGKDPLDDAESANYPELKDLIQSSDAGWKGPYLSYGIDSYKNYNPGANTFKGSQGEIFAQRLLNTDFVKSPAAMTSCDGVNPCYNWMSTCSTDSAVLSLYAAIDKIVDGAASEITGNLRYLDWSGNKCVYLKGPRKFTN